MDREPRKTTGEPVAALLMQVDARRPQTSDILWTETLAKGLRSKFVRSELGPRPGIGQRIKNDNLGNPTCSGEIHPLNRKMRESNPLKSRFSVCGCMDWLYESRNREVRPKLALACEKGETSPGRAGVEKHGPW